MVYLINLIKLNQCRGPDLCHCRDWIVPLWAVTSLCANVAPDQVNTNVLYGPRTGTGHTKSLDKCVQSYTHLSGIESIKPTGAFF